MTRILKAALVAAALAALPAAWVGAQMPPHTPGSICVTPKFWCWAQPPGTPGATCLCFTPQGPVRGVLR